MPDGRQFLAAHTGLESVDLLICDVNGILRGKIAPPDSLKKVDRPGINLPLSIFGLDIWGREVDSTGLHISSGDLDGLCRAVRGRIDMVPWARSESAQVLMTMHTEDGRPFGADPRHALARLAERCGERGLRPSLAFEVEFYLVEPRAYLETGRIAENSDSGPDWQEMYAISALGEHEAFFAEVREAAKRQNLPIDTLVKEAAPGQFEVNLRHRDDPLAAADDAVLLRRLIQNIAASHELAASFMAKPFADWPGSGMHVHASLTDRAGGNHFADAEGETRLRHAIAGLMATMPEALLAFVPGVNAFRRLKPQSYAPSRVAWGNNNRSVALRVPASDARNRRIEHRLAGADANPYLVAGAMLGGMLEGLDGANEPPPAIVGDVEDSEHEGIERLTPRMDEAIEAFARSDFITRTFGADLQAILTAVKRTEYLVFENEITRLERETYF